MKLWVDDIRPAPEGWCQVYSVNAAKEIILTNWKNIEMLSIDYDSGDYNKFGGDYINILKWLEEEEHKKNKKIATFPIHVHSMNPVGIENMRNIIRYNNWKEVPFF